MQEVADFIERAPEIGLDGVIGGGGDFVPGESGEAGEGGRRRGEGVGVPCAAGYAEREVAVAGVGGASVVGGGVEELVVRIWMGEGEEGFRREGVGE